jgi:hypothetical protein
MGSPKIGVTYHNAKQTGQSSKSKSANAGFLSESRTAQDCAARVMVKAGSRPRDNLAPQGPRRVFSCVANSMEQIFASRLSKRFEPLVWRALVSVQERLVEPHEPYAPRGCRRAARHGRLRREA